MSQALQAQILQKPVACIKLRTLSWRRPTLALQHQRLCFLEIYKGTFFTRTLVR